MEFDMFEKPSRKNPAKTKAGRKKASKKAAVTRKKNAAKRSAAGRKGAATRKRHEAAKKRPRAAKPRRNVSAGVGARVGGLKAGVGARVTARSNPHGVSAARVAKVEKKLTQVVKTQHMQGAKITKLTTRVTRLDGVRKALGLPASGGSMTKREDEIQDRAIAMEMAARRHNPRKGKKHAKRGKRRGHKHGKK